MAGLSPFLRLASALTLLYERLCTAFWASAALAAGFIGLGFLNLPQSLPPALHAALLAAVGIAMIKTAQPFRFPSGDAVARAIEHENGLPHNPLLTLRDRPASGDLSTWDLHQGRARQILTTHKLKVYRPRINVNDPYRLSALALAFFLIAGLIAGREAPVRLTASLTPDLAGAITGTSVRLNVWITPPAYTGIAPVYLTRDGKPFLKDAAVPSGSLLQVRAAGYRIAPTAHYAGNKITAAEYPLNDSGRLTLRLFSFIPLHAFTLRVTPDTAPAIAITQAEATPGGRIKISYAQKDDYGIKTLSGVLEQGEETARFDLSAPPKDVAETSITADLADHPWAGEAVTLKLEATDAAGHTTTSAAAAITLPERRFTNPAARLLAEARKTLRRDASPASRRAIAQSVFGIAERGSLYRGDPVTFLALVVTAYRIVRDEALTDVDRLLWTLALKLDDGGASMAREDARAALQALMEKLKNKSSTAAEIENLLADAQIKMQDYMRTLAEEWQARAQEGRAAPLLSPGAAERLMAGIDPAAALNDMRRLLQAQGRAGLERMTDALQRMLEESGEMAPLTPEQEQMIETLNTLDALIRRQQSLYDETNKAEDGARGRAREQAAIRSGLENMTQKLKPAPDNLTRATVDMGKAEKELRGPAPRKSLPHQRSALQALQEAMDGAAKKAAQMLMPSPFPLFGLTGQDEGGGQDPLGRPLHGRDVGIPKAPEQRRVQKILEELRTRANDPARPQIERNYLEKLIDLF